jgi:carbon-monoxide dehydrogenase medium subunit
MVARSTRGERVIAAKEFFDSIMTTMLVEYELLTEVRLPVLAPGTRFGFCEFNRRAGDFAMAMALVTLVLKKSVIAEARVALGGAEAVPRRIAEAEAVLDGCKPGADAFAAAAKAAADAIDPLDDAEISADYRRALVRTVVQRALERAAQ